jgi:hypothetical protein
VGHKNLNYVEQCYKKLLTEDRTHFATNGMSTRGTMIEGKSIIVTTEVVETAI